LEVSALGVVAVCRRLGLGVVFKVLDKSISDIGGVRRELLMGSSRGAIAIGDEETGPFVTGVGFGDEEKPSSVGFLPLD
jgi:hypothetical protein